MGLIVQKFGGTSVGTIEKIEQVADKVARFRAEGHELVVVVSAMSGETNRLISLAHEVMEAPTPREMDVLVSTGEQVTTALLCMALHKRKIPARSYNGSQVRILTDDAHTKARIKDIDDERLHADLAEVLDGLGIGNHLDIDVHGLDGGVTEQGIAVNAGLLPDPGFGHPVNQYDFRP